MPQPLSPDRIALVQTTWSRLVPVAYPFARSFYERLFAVDPSSEALFAGCDLSEQAGKLVEMLGTMVRNLSDPRRLRPTAGELGRRHAGYGVRPRHYDSMRTALLWTLERHLGAAFTADARDAWADAYSYWAALMQSDASPAPADAADD